MRTLRVPSSGKSFGAVDGTTAVACVRVVRTRTSGARSVSTIGQAIPPSRTRRRHAPRRTPRPAQGRGRCSPCAGLIATGSIVTTSTTAGVGPSLRTASLRPGARTSRSSCSSTAASPDPCRGDRAVAGRRSHMGWDDHAPTTPSAHRTVGCNSAMGEWRRYTTGVVGGRSGESGRRGQARRWARA